MYIVYIKKNRSEPTRRNRRRNAAKEFRLDWGRQMRDIYRDRAAYRYEICIYRKCCQDIYEKANKQADELRACRRMRRWLTGCQVEGRGGWTPFEAKEIRSMQLSLLTFYYICNWQHHSHLHEYETICKHWESELQIACLRYLESNSIGIYLISNLNWRKIEDYKVGKVKQCWY